MIANLGIRGPPANKENKEPSEDQTQFCLRVGKRDFSRRRLAEDIAVPSIFFTQPILMGSLMTLAIYGVTFVHPDRREGSAWHGLFNPYPILIASSVLGAWTLGLLVLLMDLLGLHHWYPERHPKMALLGLTVAIFVGSSGRRRHAVAIAELKEPERLEAIHFPHPAGVTGWTSRLRLVSCFQLLGTARNGP